jgi:hypothetical protein
MRLSAVRRLCGHVEGGPTGVAPQSTASTHGASVTGEPETLLTGTPLYETAKAEAKNIRLACSRKREALNRRAAPWMHLGGGSKT